jgi:hypothetical protein
MDYLDFVFVLVLVLVLARVQDQVQVQDEVQVQVEDEVDVLLGFVRAYRHATRSSSWQRRSSSAWRAR